MADFFKLSLVLQAAEMLEQPKMQHFTSTTSPVLRVRRLPTVPSDDDAVPDIAFASSSRPSVRPRSPFAYDDDAGSDDASSGMGGEDHPNKRTRLITSRMLNARNSDTHNSVEKRRRAYLASCYEGLKDSVPVLAGSRASNVKVLRGAASYIKTLEAEERRMIAEKKRLMEQQQELLREREKRTHELEVAPTVPCLARIAYRMPRRTSSDNDVAFTLMQLSGIAASS